MAAADAPPDPPARARAGAAAQPPPRAQARAPPSPPPAREHTPSSCLAGPPAAASCTPHFMGMTWPEVETVFRPGWVEGEKEVSGSIPAAEVVAPPAGTTDLAAEGMETDDEQERMLMQALEDAVGKGTMEADKFWSSRREESNILVSPSTDGFGNYASVLKRVTTLIDEQKWALSEPLVRDLVHQAEQAYGSLHENTLHALSIYAGVLWNLGRVAESQRCLEMLVGAREKLFIALPDAETAEAVEATCVAAERLADALGELATVLMESGQSRGATATLRRVQELLAYVYGDESDEVSSCLTNLARSLAEEARTELDRDPGSAAKGFEEAVTLMRKAVALQEKLHGLNSQEVADLTSELAVLLQECDRPEDAEKEARKALGRYVAVFGERHEFTATCLNNLALMQHAHGNSHSAENMLRRCLAIFEDLFGPVNEQYISVLSSLVDVLWELQRVDEAASMLERQLELQKKLSNPPAFDIGQGHAALANLLWDKSDVRGALHHLQMASHQFERAKAKALAELVAEETAALAGGREMTGNAKKAVEDVSLELASVYNSTGMIMQEQKRLDDAREAFERSVQMYQEALGERHAFVAIGQHNLGLLYHSMGRANEARKALETSLETLDYTMGCLSAETKLASDSLLDFIGSHPGSAAGRASDILAEVQLRQHEYGAHLIQSNYRLYRKRLLRGGPRGAGGTRVPFVSKRGKQFGGMAPRMSFGKGTPSFGRRPSFGQRMSFGHQRSFARPPSFSKGGQLSFSKSGMPMMNRTHSYAQSQVKGWEGGAIEEAVEPSQEEAQRCDAPPPLPPRRAANSSNFPSKRASFAADAPELTDEASSDRAHTSASLRDSPPSSAQIAGVAVVAPTASAAAPPASAVAPVSTEEAATGVVNKGPPLVPRRRTGGTGTEGGERTLKVSSAEPEHGARADASKTRQTLAMSCHPSVAELTSEEGLSSSVPLLRTSVSEPLVNEKRNLPQRALEQSCAASSQRVGKAADRTDCSVPISASAKSVKHGSCGSFSSSGRESQLEDTRARLGLGRAQLHSGQHRLAEATLRLALLEMENIFGKHQASKHIDWQQGARSLVETLLKEPVLPKLMEAELLLWRVFEGEMASSEGSRVKSTRELHADHTKKLALLELAQRRAAAIIIQREQRKRTTSRGTCGEHQKLSSNTINVDDEPLQTSPEGKRDDHREGRAVAVEASTSPLVDSGRRTMWRNQKSDGVGDDGDGDELSSRANFASRSSAAGLRQEERWRRGSALARAFTPGKQWRPEFANPDMFNFQADGALPLISSQPVALKDVSNALKIYRQAQTTYMQKRRTEADPLPEQSAVGYISLQLDAAADLSAAPPQPPPRRHQAEIGVGLLPSAPALSNGAPPVPPRSHVGLGSGRLPVKDAQLQGAHDAAPPRRSVRIATNDTEKRRHSSIFQRARSSGPRLFARKESQKGLSRKPCKETPPVEAPKGSKPDRSWDATTRRVQHQWLEGAVKAVDDESDDEVEEEDVSVALENTQGDVFVEPSNAARPKKIFERVATALRLDLAGRSGRNRPEATSLEHGDSFVV